MRLISILVLIYFSGFCSSQLYSYGKSGSNFPTGLENQMICGRQTWMKIYVCDPDKVLGKDDIEASQLDKIIRKIANETRCPCSHYSCSSHPGGYKIGIAIVKKLSEDELTANVDDDQYDQREIQDRLMTKNLNEAQKFAQNVKQQWKLGRCGEDVIIFYSHEDKVVYTATGEVAAKKLTKKLIQDIAINARVNGFSRSAFDGVFSIINDYRAVFLDSYKQKAPKNEAQISGSPLTKSPSPTLALVSAVLFSISKIF